MHIPENESISNKQDIKILARLWPFARKHRWMIMLTFLCLLVVTAVQVTLPIITKHTIDNFIENRFVRIDKAESTFNIAQKHAAYLIEAADSIFIPAKLLSKGEMLHIQRSQDSNQARQHGNPRLEQYYKIDDEDVKVIEKNNIHYIAIDDKKLIAYSDLKKLSKKDIKKIRGNDIRMLAKYAALYFVLLVISFLFNYFQVVNLAMISENIMFDIRNFIVKHILSLSMKFHNTNAVGTLVTRATNDVAATSELLVDVIIYATKDILTIAGILIVMSFLSIKLSIIVYVMIPFMVILLYLFRHFARKAYRRVRDALSALNRFISESISGVRLIQSFNKQEKVFKDFQEINKENYRANMNQLTTMAVFRPSIDVAAHIMLALVVYFGGKGILNGAFSIGLLVAFISYNRRLFRPLFEFSEKYNVFQSGMAAFEKIFNVLDERDLIPEKKTSPARPLKENRAENIIEFKNVSFEYKSGEPVLRNVSFTIKDNESIAFVGATGAGKSTIINLVLRFYDVNEGEILLNGTNIKDIPLGELRAQFSLVLQDVFLFAGDIAYNIRLNNELSDEKMLEYAKYVNADTFIQKMKNKYSSVVAERGSDLSVGQRQLIAFTRALSTEPRILILDEATSSIDSETEHLIQDAIDKIMKQRTCIAIAHRLSTIQDADRIFVMHKGEIIESGNHADLLKKEGHYYQLYKHQYIK